MAAQEDQALLFLIFQHLKVNGFSKAARVLEKHLPQVEAPPAESLHDIYSGWMKLCSLANNAKQETDDSLNKKSIKVEFITSEEEAADSKLCAVSEEDEVKAELTTECESDVVESSHPEKIPESPLEPQSDTTTSVPLQVLDEEKSGSSDGKMEEEEMKEEPTNIQQEGSVEESAEASNEEKVSLDPLETVRSSQSESDPALDGELTGTPQEDAEASKELITNPITSEVPGEAPASERTDSDVAKAPDVLDDEKDEEQNASEPTELISVNLTEEATNDQPVEHQAPPPEDCATEKQKDEEEEQEEEQNEEEQMEQEEEEQMEQEEEEQNEEEAEEIDENSESPGSADLPSELNPDAVTEESTNTPKPTEAADLNTPFSDVPEEPDASIILRLQTDVEAAQQEGSRSVPEESSESCADPKTPRKKKKKRNKRNTETPETETQVTDTPSDPGDTPLTSKSSKKKRRRRKKGEDDQKKEEEAAEEEVVPAATSEKKKAKKRKRDKDNTLETKTTEIQVEDLEVEENTPAETTEKPKKKKRKKGKEAPCEEVPAEGDEEKIDSNDDGSSALLVSAKKKKRLCRKLSLMIRPRFHGKRMNSIQSRQKTGKKKPKEETLDEKSQMNPVMIAQADDETDIKPPKRKRKKKMKIITEQEESSLKENKPPGKEKKSMKTQRDENGVGEELPVEDLSPLSNEGKKKKKKKQKKRVKDENVEESSGSADVSQPPRSKKKKKSLKAGLDDGDSHTPAVSAKKKKSSS